MQRNETILSIAKEIVGDISVDEATVLHDEYQSDVRTTVCPCCNQATDASDLVYVQDSSGSWEDPPESHNECPHCGIELSASSLDKPDFETWLRITA